MSRRNLIKIKAGTVVSDADGQMPRAFDKRDGNGSRPGVLSYIVQGFLHHTIHNILDGRRERPSAQQVGVLYWNVLGCFPIGTERFERGGKSMREHLRGTQL